MKMKNLLMTEGELDQLPGVSPEHGEMKSREKQFALDVPHIAPMEGWIFLQHFFVQLLEEVFRIRWKVIDLRIRQDRGKRTTTNLIQLKNTRQ